MSGSATESVRTDWNSQARAWFDQRESMFAASRPIHEWLVKNLDPRNGQRVLEVAAGPGDTGFLAAKHLGSGRLVSTDLSPEMVDVARQARGRAGNSERRLSRARRAGDGPRRRVVRRRALPLGLHAHARPRGRATRVQAGARPGRTSRVRRLHRSRGEPVRVPAGANADGARASSPPHRRLAARHSRARRSRPTATRCSTASASRPRASSRSRWRGTSRTRTPIGIFSSS